MHHRTALNSGFTLVELIVVIAIIALLATLMMPEVEKMTERARSVACMGNLRSIGTSVNTYVIENDQTFPFVEPNPNDPVYTGEVEAKPMLAELEPYGVTSKVLKCPDDRTYFAATGSSYQWVPIIDGESKINPQVYGRRGARRVNPARMRLCIDFEAVHFNRCNRLYADGHAVATLK
jgi:prepilin-type N-terminal cleavage/methylation domain-containing protein/prepilin-type processing-associated H-X9-DG protein